MNRYIMFFVQTSTRPPNMHLKLTKHGRFYKQNNELPTKSHNELKDISNVEKMLKNIEHKMDLHVESIQTTLGIVGASYW